MTDKIIEVMARAMREKSAVLNDAESKVFAQAALDAIKAAGFAVVEQDVMRDLMQRMPWSGGKSPIVFQQSGHIMSKPARNSNET